MSVQGSTASPPANLPRKAHAEQERGAARRISAAAAQRAKPRQFEEQAQPCGGPLAAAGLPVVAQVGGDDRAKRGDDGNEDHGEHAASCGTRPRRPGRRRRSRSSKWTIM